MPKRALAELTQSMLYVLMALARGPMCGTDIAGYIEKLTKGRVRLGPATLYTLLNKFESEKYIREIQVEGRKRTYTITDKGRRAYEEELQRLKACLADSERGVEEG